MENVIPKNAIIILSGVSCVGKTTAAYKIIQRCSVFRRVSELDIIRTIVRSVVGNLATDGYLNYDDVEAAYLDLFKSLTISDFETAKSQSKILIPYVKEIILRQQRRNIPTVLEGAGIIPSTYYPNNCPLSWLTSTLVFINLYLKDEMVHIERRCSRCNERDYADTFEETKDMIQKIRNQKNELLHQETLELSKKFNNIFSIDVSGMTQDSVADTILKLVYKYYSTLRL
ncbi:MAG: hypothetical protein J1F18_15170 [Lachnospiraceae bacterium]|nr:hypothetical protein [Lachnospiraceae bacterium]